MKTTTLSWFKHKDTKEHIGIFIAWNKSCNHFICTFSLFVCTQQSIFLFGLLSSKFEFYIFVVAHKKFLFFIIADCHSNESTEYCVYKPHFSIQVKIELNEFLLFFLLILFFEIKFFLFLKRLILFCIFEGYFIVLSLTSNSIQACSQCQLKTWVVY